VGGRVTILAFAWRNWRKQHKISVRITGVPPGTQTEGLLNISLEGYRYTWPNQTNNLDTNDFSYFFFTKLNEAVQLKATSCLPRVNLFQYDTNAEDWKIRNRRRNNNKKKDKKTKY
jgi:hypothetical protein